jgi:hypothetical protein
VSCGGVRTEPQKWLERAGRRERKMRIKRKKTMANRRVAKTLVVLTIAAAPVALSAMPTAAASGPAPGTGLTGACNMLHDSTMLTTPMTVDAAQGNAGMCTAVAVSGCS